MIKIKAVSRNGFLVDDTWYPVNKKDLESDWFKSLKKGLVIESFSQNGAGFVTGIVLPKDSVKPAEELLIDKPSKQDRDRLRDLCLRIAADKHPGNLDFKDNVDGIIKNAHNLFEKLEASGYYNW